MGFNDIMNKLLRAGEGKVLRELMNKAKQVGRFEEVFAQLDDTDFPEQTNNLKQRYWGASYDELQRFLAGEIAFNDDLERIDGPGTPQILRPEVPITPLGDPLEDLLLEAFALVREAAKRTIGLRHFDEQLMGGAALFNGNIAEMKTGEGKTLVATAPAYLAAIAGLGVHIVTVNDYLASYQSEIMGRVFNFLGLSVGCIVSNQTPELRRAQYNADITYGTNNEFGFDYLRDNMAMSRAQLVQRGHFFAIVDEVDSILIDEARTPLIISGKAGGDLTEMYVKFAKFAKNYITRATNIDTTTPELLKRLQTDGEVEPPNGDYEVDEKKKTVGVLDTAIDKLEKYLGIDNLYNPENTHLVQFLQNAIRAKELFIRDKDYIVVNGEVKIVDEHTGRVLDGRRYSEGMHQAIEAKEGVKIQEENQTYATITLQNYFRLYKKLSGMTGTAETEAAEFNSTYKLGVIPIPTHKPMIRIDQPDFLYKNIKGKYAAIVDDIKYRNEIGQPVLIGTISVEKSEEISQLLKMAGIKHNVLNAKQHAREASIIAEAGRKGAVTVATNMAGRGTDIMLGGNPEFRAHNQIRAQFPSGDESIWSDSSEYANLYSKLLKQEQKNVEDEHNEVVELGGLYVLGTERHESRRIDNQLRGRSGRQGDPGESRFYISFEDDLMRLFGGGQAQRIMQGINFPDDAPLESKMLSKTVQSAQAKIEGRNFEIRKNVLKYDDVMTKQRTVMYKERNRVLYGENLASSVEIFIESTISDIILTNVEGAPEEWDLGKIWREVNSYFSTTITPEDVVDAVGGKIGSLTEQVLIQELISDAKLVYAERVDFFGDTFREFERQVTLNVLDRFWRQHLYAMDYLKEGIGLRAMAQKDPLVEYTNEGSLMFNQMNVSIQHEIVRTLLKAPLAQTDSLGNVKAMNERNQVVDVTLTGPSDDAGADVMLDAVGSGAASRGRGQGAVGGAQSKAQVKQAISKKKQARAANSEGSNEYSGTPKNDPCPCGSGKKYKMCHGRGE
ncbi:MAG: preprotein translocase subunit SecA [Candidatus Ancillula sp.]|jgi:preprotein translocase subunit SecA|nr:preprotein translocase subunit SecA [Candidatus Ancillula sp.]